MRVRNKEKQLEYQRAFYKRNKKKVIKEVSDRKKMVWNFLRWIKSSIGCIECGFNSHFSALQFHHNNGREEYTSKKWTSSGWGITKIQEELQKCVVLCANCHAIRHWS